MKIAFIGLRMFPSEFEGVSGLEIRNEKIIKKLSLKKDFSIYVLVRSWVREKKKNRKYKNIKIIRIFSLKNKYLDTLIYSFLSTIKSFFLPVDLIFFEGTGSSFFSFLPHLFKKKIIVTIHSLEWKRRKWGVLARLFLKLSEIIILKSANQIVVVSKDLENYFLKKYRKKTIYIPFFNSSPRIEKADIIKKKYGLKKDNYILYLGRFVPEKRIDWLIKSYLSIKTKYYLVLSGGESHSKKYYSYLKNIANKNKKIIFTGYVFKKEKEELFSNCFLFVLPSSLEGMSIALVEALNHRTKILVPDFPEHKRLIANNKYLFKKDSYQNFKNKLYFLIANKQSINKKDYRSNNFFSEKKFTNLYKKLIFNTILK